MNFLKNVFHFDSDAGPFEKAITVIVPVAVAILLGWLILASYGVGNSDLARAHEASRGNASVWATVIFLIAGLWSWFNWTDRIPFKVNDVVATVILLVLIILGVNANTGFFTHVY